MTLFVYERLTKCDSGLTLNPLMHVFLFITFAFGLAFVLPSGFVAGIATTALYAETAAFSGLTVNLWGAAAIASVILHVLGLLIRGKWGTQLLQFAWFLGFFVWLWAAVIYLSGGFAFQFIVGALPNLLFWLWYAWQWRRRYHNKRVAFV